MLRSVLIIEVTGYLGIHPAAREPKGQIEYFHNGETPTGILNMREAHICDARDHTIVHLDR